MIIIYENYNNHKYDKFNQIIKILVRQTSRWSNAAQQDTSPLVSVLHANYGAGYLWALHDIATDNEIYNATGIDSKKFTQKIIDIQDNATMKLYNLCPKYGNNLDINLFKIGK